VWIEKDALLGVIAPVCRRLRLPYFSTKGNVGQLPVHDAGLRFADQLRLGLVPVVLHLADHDPTGIEMTFDLERRLSATIEALRAELKPLNAADGNGPIDLPNPLQRRGLN
jgi:hypothetical protein